MAFKTRIINWLVSDRVRSYCLLIGAGFAITLTTIYLFNYTRELLHERLRERLIALATTASLLFDADEVDYLIQNEEESINSSVRKEITKKLELIRHNYRDIRYVYIFARSSDPNHMKFVADADIVMMKPELRFLGSELSDSDWVGALYDVTDLPALRDGIAFSEATTDADLYQEEWGMVFSAYAPIRDQITGMANAVIGIDVDVTTYLNIVYETFVPFLGFVLSLLIIISILTYVLVQMWQVRVNLVQELDRQKDELLSIVSHQLATPVSSLKWYIEMMSDGDLGKITKAQMEHLQSMAGISTNLSDLVSMILDVSRIQLGRIKVEKQAINLKEVFDEILTIIAPKAEEKGVKFNVDIPKTFPKAQLDKRYTHMVIENLLSNAVKYTPKDGTVSLNVSIKGNIMSLSVKDTGCGIPLKDQAQIFGKLFRASNVRNSVEGNGFGLFVAKGAVEAQGGSIRFESKEGTGTTFFVDLPLADSVKVKKKVK